MSSCVGGRYRVSDEQACQLLGIDSLGFADLYDVNDVAVKELAGRFGLELDPEGKYFLIGREQS